MDRTVSKKLNLYLILKIISLNYHLHLTYSSFINTLQLMCSIIKGKFSVSQTHLYVHAIKITENQKIT